MRSFAWLVAACALCCGSAWGQEPAPFVLSFYGATWTDPPLSPFFHAFMCIDTRLSSGSKTDCYGFYPATSSKAVIGGPGRMHNDDFRRIPDAVDPNTGKSAVISGIGISEDQRRRIFQLMDQWDSKQYQLTNTNCIDFVDQVFTMLGLKTPDRTKFQTPWEYIAAAKELNKP